MIDVQSLLASKQSMAQGIIDSRRAKISSRGFGAYYDSAIQSEPVFIRHNEAEKAEKAQPAEESSPARPTILDPSEYDGLIAQKAAKYGVDPNLVKSVMKSESNFRINAVSSAGAMGLMQLMPGTAKDMGVTDPYDPEQNIEGGVKYLARMLKRFDGDVALALAAYNCGPNRVENLGVQSSADTEQFSRLAGNVQRYAMRVLQRAGYTLGSIHNA